LLVRLQVGDVHRITVLPGLPGHGRIYTGVGPREAVFKPAREQPSKFI